MNQDKLLQVLLDTARRLHPTQIGLVIGVAEILKKKVEVAKLPSSDIANDFFMVAFGNRLLLHHAFTYAPLSKKHFEHALEAAANESGSVAKVIENPTNPGEDMMLNDARCSLKTEAAASIRDNEITISKFSEARWIQQCTDLQQLADSVIQRIPAQLAHSDRMFILRFFNRKHGLVEYQLVEIPIALLNLIANLTISDFSPRTTQGGSRAPVRVGTTQAFKLTLDGSDGKIAITNLLLSQCITHGTWRFVAKDLPEEISATPSSE